MSPCVTVKVKWGKESYQDVELNTDEPPLLFKAQLFALTGVQPERQKLMVKGKVVTDDSWDGFQVKEVMSIPCCHVCLCCVMVIIFFCSGCPTPHDGNCR